MVLNVFEFNAYGTMKKQLVDKLGQSVLDQLEGATLMFYPVLPKSNRKSTVVGGVATDAQVRMLYLEKLGPNFNFNVAASCPHTRILLDMFVGVFSNEVRSKDMRTASVPYGSIVYCQWRFGRGL